MKKKPITIIKQVFGLLEGQTLSQFKAEADELKSHENYKQFIEECAATLDGVEVDWS